MTRRIIRTATIALAAAALAAPTALARTDAPPAVTKAAAAAQHKQDLRSADARDAATKHEQDARPHEENVGAYTPGATPAVSYPSGATAHNSATRPSVPGPPTWPVNPQPINPVPAVHASDTGGGLDWTTVGLGIAGSLIALAGVVGIGRRSRRLERARLTA